MLCAAPKQHLGCIISLEFLVGPSRAPVRFPQFVGDIESLKDCPLQVLNLSGDGGYVTKFTGTFLGLGACAAPVRPQRLTLRTFLQGN